ncbi:FAD-binding protein [Acidiferrimicrobium sp. IK]|uniref:FAD-binding protein n=1 Tax=Acidiferrimicrobium sp. IK TaxID=2871700 RepID=UPI0021CB0A8A|nr:FAD-binding protein [Acidiferrimicrobium sp. IK]MCU4184433.1 FAD-binding protein [Acidiferrimicrobium sp. IK]
MTARAVAALDDFAAEVGTVGTVAVEGCRTRWSAGGPPEPGARLVRAPEGVLEHRPEEMTVRVRAGTAVAELHSALAEKGQRSALPERGGTVGGALAVGEDDLSVLGRGRVRDALLQVRYVSADGRVVTGGGPTVKNVSGFDLPRLFVGSLGTLGLIGEVILRTNPIPPASEWLSSPDADPFAVAASLHKPGAVLWDGVRTWVQLEGHADDVGAQARALETLGSWEPASGPPEVGPHRWSLRPGELRGVPDRIAGDWVASIGVGTVFASEAPPLRSLAGGLGRLAKRMKAEFDPTGRLNPGRHPGGGI